MQTFRAWASKLQMTVSLPSPPRHRERAMEVGDELAPALQAVPNAGQPNAEAVELLAKAIRVIKHLKTRCDAAETGLREALEAQAAAAEAASLLARTQDGRIDALERQVAAMREALQAVPAAPAAPEQPPVAETQEVGAPAPVILDLAAPAPRVTQPAALGELAQRRTADADAIRQLLGWASAVLADEDAAGPRRAEGQAQPAERRLAAA